jgi:hypothetical protein
MVATTAYRGRALTLQLVTVVPILLRCRAYAPPRSARLVRVPTPIPGM